MFQTQFVFTTEQIRKAPIEVREWMLSNIIEVFDVGKPVEPPKPEAPGLTHDEVKAAAVSLAERKGTDAVLTILKSMGIRRVADCPKDRLSELLEAVQGA
jgi:hypothetical protein